MSLELRSSLSHCFGNPQSPKSPSLYLTVVFMLAAESQFFQMHNLCGPRRGGSRGLTAPLAGLGGSRGHGHPRWSRLLSARPRGLPGSLPPAGVAGRSRAARKEADSRPPTCLEAQHRGPPFCRARACSRAAAALGGSRAPGARPPGPHSGRQGLGSPRLSAEAQPGGTPGRPGL